MLHSTVAAPVRAQQTEETRSATARALFEEGVAFVDQKQWDQAADRFRRALELRPSPVIRFNLGVALAELGEVVEATELLRQVQRNEDAKEQVRTKAREWLTKLEPRIAELTIRLTGHPEDVDVRLDGTQIDDAVLGVGMPVDPGTYRVEAQRQGQVIASQQVDVASSGQAEVTLEIPAPPPDEPPGAHSANVPDPKEAAANTTPPRPGARRPTDSDDRSQRLVSSPWLWVAVAAVAAGGIAAGVALGVRGSNDNGMRDPFMSDLPPVEIE